MWPPSLETAGHCCRRLRVRVASPRNPQRANKPLAQKPTISERSNTLAQNSAEAKPGRQKDDGVNAAAQPLVPSDHTRDGGVLIGSENARRRLIVFEDLQCPYCREFDEVAGDLLRREVAAGSVAVEYRIRSFLGPESVRAANALAAAAEAGHFDQLRRELFARQPAENSGGFTTEDLLEAGLRAGLTSHSYATAVREGRYEQWVLERERAFREQDPAGTPAAVLDGRLLDSQTLLDPEALGAAIRA
jgi:protein-disulfide isomerase